MLTRGICDGFSHFLTNFFINLPLLRLQELTGIHKYIPRRGAARMLAELALSKVSSDSLLFYFTVNVARMHAKRLFTSLNSEDNVLSQQNIRIL